MCILHSPLGRSYLKQMIIYVMRCVICYGRAYYTGICIKCFVIAFANIFTNDLVLRLSLTLSFVTSERQNKNTWSVLIGLVITIY